MSVQALKIDDGADGVIVIHRNFSGEHVLEGTSCWCRPVVDDASLDAEQITEILEECDG